ncbi:MAG: hypothetical protein JW918_06065 [Anaerolineae bacterium]|nr:hypothetical protein [Anaerolineae bacterium]
MIILLPHLVPSELLYYNEQSPFINELLRDSCSHRQDGLFSDALQFAQRALSNGREARDRVSQGAAWICLADVHREMGKLGPALGYCQKAQRIFNRQPSRYQRHNESVAAYALGLAHHLLGNDVDALKWYQTACKQFEKARQEWTAVNASRRVEDCDSVLSWLEILTKNLIADQSGLDANLSTRIQVPIVRSNGERGRFAIVEMAIDRYRVGRDLTINGDSFRLHSVKGNRRVTLEPGTECYALEIPDEACESLEAGEGDYALVIRGKDADREGPGVLETLSGTEFGDFKRGEEGKINFVTFKAAVVLGSDEIADDFEVGYIAALLKREPKPSPAQLKTSTPPAPKQPAASPSTPSQPEQPAASVSSYHRLIRLVKGNKEIADRLIEHERQLKPEATLAELAESAIARLVRDRH